MGMMAAPAATGGTAVSYQEIPGAHHNTLLQDALPDIVKAMEAARQSP
jgi:hypothetical protein